MAPRSNTTGHLNLAVGGSALRSNNSYPVANTAVGFEAFANADRLFLRRHCRGEGGGA